MSSNIEERKLIAKVIDVETGEVIDDIHEGDKIIHSVMDNEQIKNYNGDKKFVKLFDGTEELHKLLNNDGVFSTAIRLSKFVCYDDCVLRTGGHKNGKILDTKELSDIMNVHIVRCVDIYRFYLKMVCWRFVKLGQKGIQI